MGTPRTDRSWQVSDTETKALKPQSGFIHDYLSYMEESNDAPLWYHMGAILTVMGTAAGRRDLRVVREDGKQHYLPMHMWSAIVGNSGERKSAALDPATRLLYQVNPPSILATDGSPEAWHDRLAMEETFGSSMGMLYFFFIICMIIAMVVAASAIIISTMERDIEFATLETLGIPRLKVIGSMLIEIGIIGFFSALLGLPFAYLFGKLFAIVMEDILYYFPIVFTFGAMIITFAFGFLFVFGSSLFPIRYAGKLDAEKTIRERTAG